MAHGDTPRETVRRAVTFSGPGRIPRHLWLLPWAEMHYPEAVRALEARFPSDIVECRNVYRPSRIERGDPYAAGTYTDPWGCVFENLQPGVIGEVKVPFVRDLPEWRSVEPPFEQIPENRERANGEIRRFCESTDRFVLANMCPRPWERYQFLRGSPNAYMDLMDRDSGFDLLLGRIHEFYLEELDFWASSAVDGIMFMDDWGSQDRLLIRPELWREIFKPLYRDYCEAAHAGGKLAFMHSDGCITDIIPDLIEAGVDALNAQLFCMDLEEVARTAGGRITFWGEIDRQHVLRSPDPEEGRRAVRRVADLFYDPSGGLIAQFEFGPGVHPETAYAVFEEWERVEESFRSRSGNPCNEKKNANSRTDGSGAF